MKVNQIICGDALEVLRTLPSESIDCCITSPPYWGLRDYGVSGQFGLEKTPEEYVANLVAVFQEVKRILKNEGTFWLNLGDTYYNYRGETDYSIKQTIAKNDAHKLNSATGKRNHKQENLKGKDLVGIPWMVAFALRKDGWYLRQDIIWAKPNPMPESVTDRCTKSHEYIFLLTKSPKYYFDNEAIKEKSVDEESYTGRRFRGKKSIYIHNAIPKRMNHQTMDKGNNELLGKKFEKRNKRSVWTITTKPFKAAHFATFPEDLVVPMIKAGCPKGGIVLDPFFGAGTTGVVAKKLQRNYLGIELNPEYIKIAEKRLQAINPML